MDIDILLVLQNFRNGAGAVFADFLSKMTFLGETNTVLVLMAAIYWCVNKSFGTYLLMGWNGGTLVNGLLKVTACVYRPWVADARIVPYGNSMTTATGYSFPSGHSTSAATVFGGGAIRKELPKVLRVVLGVILALVAFSRIYLGVHRPQDILVGSTVSLLLMWLFAKLLRRIEARPGKDIAVMCVGIGIAVAVAVFAACKSYPEDYDAAGKLLVDGRKMAYDTYRGVGCCIGFLTGWVLEKRWVGFSTDVPMMTKITRLTIGLFGYYAVNLILVPLLQKQLPGAFGAISACFLLMFYISFLYPWCVKRLERSADRVA